MTNSPLIHILQHEPHETPGHIADWLAQNQCRHTVFNTGDVLRDINPDMIQCLIILGGSANVDDTPRPDWMDAERALLTHLVTTKCPILGICLGSQLLADALGADVRIADHAEIGWHELLPDRSALNANGLAGLPFPARVLEFHERTFDLPAGATLLASSHYCKHQFFIANGRHFGVQFHPEWTKPILEKVIEVEPPAPNGRNIQSSAEMMAGDFDQARPFLWALLDHLISLREE